MKGRNIKNQIRLDRIEGFHQGKAKLKKSVVRLQVNILNRDNELRVSDGRDIQHSGDTWLSFWR